jgi:hypothetical protein
MQRERSERTYKPPCAGITLIRSYGYNLSLPLFLESTPVYTEVNGTKVKKKFPEFCNLFFKQPFYNK